MRDQDRTNWPDNDYPKAKLVRSQSEKGLVNNSAIDAQVTIYVPGAVAQTVADLSVNRRLQIRVPTPRCQGVAWWSCR